VGSLPPDCQCGLFAWERHSASSNALSSEHPATRRGLLQAHGCMRGVPPALRGRAGSAARARRGGARTWRRAAALLDRALQREQRAGGRVRALRLRARLAHRTARARARAHLREPAAGRALRVRAPPALKKALGGPITQNPEGLPWPLPGAGRCAVVCCSAGRDEACAHPVRGLAVFLHGGLTPALCKLVRTRSSAGPRRGGHGGARRVAGGADGVAEVDEGVAVAVRVHAEHPDEVAGRLPLAPAPLARAAVECRQPAAVAHFSARAEATRQRKGGRNRQRTARRRAGSAH